MAPALGGKRGKEEQESLGEGGKEVKGGRGKERKRE